MKKIFYLLLLPLILNSCVSSIVRDCADCIEENKIGKNVHKQDSSQLPDSLLLSLYRKSDSFSFPEERLTNFNTEYGLAISGGGYRSYSCAIGQIAGLMKLGLWDRVGMLSVLSGSSWFSVPFNYAPDSIADSDLFGGVYTMSPDSLTLENISQLEPNSLGYPISQLSNEEIVKAVCESHGEGFPGHRLFASIHRHFISYYSLGDKHSFFTFDSLSKGKAISMNPELAKSSFYQMRKNRPFFAASATIYDSCFSKHHKMHHFEYTPLYAGTLETCEHINKKGQPYWIGGGYIDNYGFNSTSPNPKTVTDSTAKVASPPYLFTLFDMMGTSGAAPGSIFDHLHVYSMMSEYNYWPLVEGSEYKSEFLSFIDGGDFENMALVPLLRRGFKKIIAFDNVDTPVGSKKASYDGVSYDIARLFGHKPKHSMINSQTVQVFDEKEFGPLCDSLKATKKRGEVPYYLGKHKVLKDNPFGITAYSEDEYVEILWITNDMNPTWKRKLPGSIEKFMSKRKNKLKNFPNYETVFQNKPEMFQLTPQQINLLANMWHYSITDSSSDLVNTINNFWNQ